MKTKEQHIDFWIEQAEDDWKAVFTLFVRLKFQKRSALKFVSRIPPKAGLKAEGIIPRPLGRNLGSGLAWGSYP
jgi:hypothetical protein